MQYQDDLQSLRRREVDEEIRFSPFSLRNVEMGV